MAVVPPRFQQIVRCKYAARDYDDIMKCCRCEKNGETALNFIKSVIEKYVTILQFGKLILRWKKKEKCIKWQIFRIKTLK